MGAPPASAEVEDRQAEEAWCDFLVARDRALRSLDIADGFACGRAWARFLDKFLPPSTRLYVASDRS